MPSSRKTTGRKRATPKKAGKGTRKAGPAAGGRRRSERSTSRPPARKRAAAARDAGAQGRPEGGRRRATAPALDERRGVDQEGATDPEGFFVARVRGEDAVREAPHPLGEAASDTGARVPEGVPENPAYDERLGDLPWGYADDAVVALPRDPRSLFLYWDHADETVRRGFEGLDHPRAQLWLFARGDAGWERIRAVEVALESRGYYVHDLEPGRTYRAELHAFDRAGRERRVGPSSNEIALPPVGPSPVIDDRFIRIPWEQPLGGLLGPGHPRPGFPEDARAALARLSDWRRTGMAYGGSPGAGGLAGGGRGGRPSSSGPGGEGER